MKTKMLKHDAMLHLVWNIAICDGDDKSETNITPEEDDYLDIIKETEKIKIDWEDFNAFRENLDNDINIINKQACKALGRCGREWKIKSIGYMKQMAWVSQEDDIENNMSDKEFELIVEAQEILNLTDKEREESHIDLPEPENKKSIISNNLISKGKDFFSNIDENLNENKDEILTFNTKKDEIISKSIPKDKDEIMDFVNFLLLTIKTNGWKFGNTDEHINSLSDVCLNKLEQCEIKLKSINEINQANYIEIEINKLKKKRRFQKYAIFVGAGIIFFIVFILYQLGLVK